MLRCNKFFDTGLIIAFIFSIIVVIIFYGELILSINSVFFGNSNDALSTYFTTIYHYKFDNTLFHFNGMNYPYGENIFFSSTHVPLVNMLKILSPILDVSEYLIGIVNFVMLFSIILCTLFIYLIFKELDMPKYYSVFASVGIAFLSPQIHRLGGTLSYEFGIPALIYFIIKFHKDPSLRKSLLISFFILFMTLTYIYFLGFFAIILACYWSTIAFIKKNKGANQFFYTAKHFFVQLLLPFFLFELIYFFTNNIDDRTKYPYGFLVYKSALDGVFFPWGKPYAYLFEQLHQPKYVEWEGQSYIGVIPLVVFLFVLLSFLKKLLTGKFNQLFWIDENLLLSILFWSGIAGLIYSFGFPFTLQHSLIEYAGALKQMRAIGRFTWMFFYIINIITFYKLFIWSQRQNNIVRKIVIPFSIIAIGFDAYYNLKGHQNELFNYAYELKDEHNNLQENVWLKHLDRHKYQAILTLPYTHVGSENITLTPNSSIMKYGYINSLKTGLPLLAVSMSRTSLSQTFKNIQMVLEPYRPLKIIADFPDKRPFLLFAKESEINQNEKNLISQCKKLTDTPFFNVYQLDIEVLEHLSDSVGFKMLHTLRSQKFYEIQQFYSSDSSKTFIYRNFDESSNHVSYNGRGASHGFLNQHNTLYDGTIPNLKINQDYLCSFWMKDFNKDLYPRSSLEFSFSDVAGKTYQIIQPSLQAALKTTDGSWALIEQEFKLKNVSDKIKITLINMEIGEGKELIIDDLLIRPSTTNIYQKHNKFILVNNRYYDLLN